MLEGVKTNCSGGVFAKILNGVLRRTLASPRKIIESPYDSWQECQNQCVNPGYSSEDLYRELAGRCRLDSDFKPPLDDRDQFPALVGLALGACKMNGRRRLRVVDFGGGMGTHYFDAYRIFGDIFDWTVIETPACVRAAEAHTINPPHFKSDLSSAGVAGRSVDLCLVSGSLQYCPKPGDIVKQLASLEAACYVIRRTPILTATQQPLAGKWWLQHSRFFHQVRPPALSKQMLRRTSNPVTFLTEDLFCPLDAIRKRSLDVAMGPLYELTLQRETVQGRTIVWTE
jgi:putative methyltransferase (TIGR04325 family)